MTGVQLWAKAIRSYSFSASLVPVAIGGLQARSSGAEFSGVRFGVSLAAGLLLHTAANLWNDYYDFKGGVDRAGGGEGSGVLVRGEKGLAHTRLSIVGLADGAQPMVNEAAGLAVSFNG